MAEEGTKISAATTTTPVSTDMIPFSRVADATARHMTAAALDTYLFDKAVVINESGADVDTRIEASGQANALFVQGSDGFVGVGTATPGKRLDVYNTDNSGAIRARGSAYTKIIVEGSTAPTYVLADTGETDPAGRFAIYTEDDLLKFARFGSADYGSFSPRLIMTAAGFLGIGLTPTANMAGLSIEAGLLTLKERATPTADAGYGKIYTKDDNNLYFQSGAGVEYAIYMIEPA